MTRNGRLIFIFGVFFTARFLDQVEVGPGQLGEVWYAR